MLPSVLRGTATGQTVLVTPGAWLHTTLSSGLQGLPYRRSAPLPTVDSFSGQSVQDMSAWELVIVTHIHTNAHAHAHAHIEHGDLISLFFLRVKPNSLIYLAVCLTTGPKPLPRRFLHTVRSRAVFLELCETAAR